MKLLNKIKKYWVELLAMIILAALIYGNTQNQSSELNVDFDPPPTDKLISPNPPTSAPKQD
jgi:hypothetical protein